VTYSEVEVTEICHNDRIALIDAATPKPFESWKPNPRISPGKYNEY
jgi:hypothetical protein